MESNNPNLSGNEIFKNFVKNSPEENPHFDYFVLLDHLSQTKFDKDLYAAIFHESIILYNTSLRKQSF
jgi:hypothetical protein